MKAADKLKKASTIKATSSLSKSEVYSSRVTVETQVPMVNVAFSGDIDSGFTSGVTIFAGPSKHFKTMFSLLCAKSFLDKYEDGVVLFYDSEFGSPPEYFKTLGIDPERVVHTPVVNVEELRTDLANQLKNIERTDRVCIVIDSLGNLASIKETEDAEAGKNVADMTRAKQIKSLFRIVTPQLTLRDIPMFVVSHTYDTMEMFSKKVVSGGCLVAGTKVRMADGSLCDIEKIQVGDYVDTRFGPRQVEKTWNPETLYVGEPECFEIEFEDGLKIVCSETHPLLVNQNGELKFIEARELQAGDEIEQVDVSLQVV
jgi:hypothetical protein